MKPLNIKPALSPAANSLSAMVVNTQCRTGVGIVRREVQSSAAWYQGQTVEMNLALQPLQTYAVVDSTSAFVLSCNNDLEFKHKPNNTHDHTLVVSQQFSADYLITGIELKNPSTTEVVEATITYVPFTGTLPEEQTCGGGGVDPVPTINGTLSWWQDSWPLPVPPDADTPTYIDEDDYVWVFQLQLDEPAPTPPYIRLRLPVHTDFFGNPVVVEYPYFDGYSNPSAGIYAYKAKLRIPAYNGGSSYGVIHIGATSTGDYRLVVPELATEDLPRAPDTPS